jgi:hypothetical protein
MAFINIEFDIIFGNILSLISCTIMVASGIIKNSQKFLFIQNVELVFAILSNVVLGGYTGAIVSAVSIIVNTLCYKEKLTTKKRVFFVVVQTVLCLIVNELNWIGLLPLFATIIGIVFITTDTKKLKIMTIVIMLLWVIYDFTIKSYIGGVFDIITIATSLMGLYRIYH